MTDLTETSNPGHLVDKCMHEPIFTELADECLKLVQNNNKVQNSLPIEDI